MKNIFKKKKTCKDLNINDFNNYIINENVVNNTQIILYNQDLVLTFTNHDILNILELINEFQKEKNNDTNN